MAEGRFRGALSGMVRFRARGGSPERFLNAARNAGVELYDVRPVEGELYATVSARRYRRLRRPARRAGARLRVVKRHGLPFVVHRYRWRWGIVAGLVLFFAVLWFLSGFVWTVNIQGNQAVSTADIERVLTNLGVRPGARSAALNLDGIENTVLSDLPGLSWITIRIQGSTATVVVRERTWAPELVPIGQPCNIKAARTGQIVLLETYEGMPLLRQGDTVKEGDIIVSGVVEEKSGAVRMAHARAKVLARTRRTLSVTVPLRSTVDAPTGKVVTRRALVVGGLQIPLSFGAEPKGSYTRTARTDDAVLFGQTLPFSLRTVVFAQYERRDETLTSRQALARAQEKLSESEKTEFAGCTVESSQYTPNVTDTGVILDGTYSIIENIGYEEAIYLS